MNIRQAITSDAEAIHSLVNYYAELDRMLFCSVSDVFEKLQIFKVAQLDDDIAGCCALQVIWKDLAEIKSLAVSKDFAGRGVGRALVEEVVKEAHKLGAEKVFTLTMEPEFFKKVGFVQVEMSTLPMKVWSDCAKCSKQDHCDEIAMVYQGQQ